MEESKLEKANAINLVAPKASAEDKNGARGESKIIKDKESTQGGKTKNLSSVMQEDLGTILARQKQKMQQAQQTS